MPQSVARTCHPSNPTESARQLLPLGLSTRHAERREADRIAFAGEVAVSWELPCTDSVLADIVDISETGLRIATAYMVPIGRRGEALHVLPERSRIGRPFVVVWSIEMPDGAFHSGVRFTDRDA